MRLYSYINFCGGVDHSKAIIYDRLLQVNTDAESGGTRRIQTNGGIMTVRILPLSREPVAHPLSVMGISFFDEDVVLLPYPPSKEGVYCLVCIKKGQMADAVGERGQHLDTIQTSDEQKRILLFGWEIGQTQIFLEEVAQSLPVPQ